MFLSPTKSNTFNCSPIGSKPPLTVSFASLIRFWSRCSLQQARQPRDLIQCRVRHGTESEITSRHTGPQHCAEPIVRLCPRHQILPRSAIKHTGDGLGFFRGQEQHHLSQSAGATHRKKSSFGISTRFCAESMIGGRTAYWVAASERAVQSTGSLAVPRPIDSATREPNSLQST